MRLNNNGYGFLRVLCVLGVSAVSIFAETSGLAPMLNLPGIGGDAAKIDYAKLPVLAGQHAIVTVGDPKWLFRLHNYLAYFEGRYWCMWSHGPVVEDKPTQHIRYAVSADGLKWSGDRIIAPPSRGQGERYIARGLWERNGKLIALATLDNDLTRQRTQSPWSADLKLLGFEWDSAAKKWGGPQLVFQDTLNNFAPNPLPDGRWAMMRRDHLKNVTMLTGGVESISQWQASPIVTAKDPGGLRAEEPEWWILPDQRLLGLFRDNAKSGRFYRAISADAGRTWTAPEKTNFPDATSKFFCLKTSRGYYVLVSNANPARRNPLCLSTSDDGVAFTRMAKLPIPESISQLPATPSAKRATVREETFQYPHLIEREGSLLIAYSRRKMTVEVIQVSLDQIDLLRGAP